MTSNKKIPATYYLTMTDNRNKTLKRRLLKDLQKVMAGIEESKPHLADILVCYSYTGDILSKKLFLEMKRFRDKDKKCYVYSESGGSIREVLKLEKSEKDFETNSMYGVVIHSGMKIERYLSSTSGQMFDKAVPK